MSHPFTWWCQACYDAKSHANLPHDIEHPIMCLHCQDLPATLRVRSVHNCAAPTYWCHICYERVEHEDEPHHVQDLDSASDESDQDDDDAKSNESYQRDEGHHEELDYEHDESASLRSDNMMKQQQQQQLDEEPKQQFNFGSWQEQQDLDFAVAMSLSEDTELDQTTSNSSSSSSSSSTATSSAIPVLQLEKQLADFKPTTLQTIQEPLGHYVGSSGCMEPFFKNEDSGAAPVVCPKHGLGYQPHCPACANHQHMVHKHRQEVAEQSALQWSFEENCLVWMDGQPTCSKHPDGMVEWCHTCRGIVFFYDEKAKKAYA